MSVIPKCMFYSFISQNYYSNDCVHLLYWFFFFTFIEIKKMSVFKNYEPGEPTCRLYVKNVAKQVEEKVSVCSTHKNKQTK